jgi:hypothetical protein
VVFLVLFFMCIFLIANNPFLEHDIQGFGDILTKNVFHCACVSPVEGNFVLKYRSGLHTNLLESAVGCRIC